MRDEDWQRLAVTMGRLSDAPLFIDDSPNMSLMQIRAKCRRLKQRNNLKLVVIDYLQLMSSGKRVESRQQEVAEFSRALKLLAKELEVPVIAISQLNRGPEQRTDKRPQMSDLRESGCLTADTRVLRADTGAEASLGSCTHRTCATYRCGRSTSRCATYAATSPTSSPRGQAGLPAHPRLWQDCARDRESPVPHVWRMARARRSAHR